MTRELPVFTVADLEAVAAAELEHFTKEDALELGVIATGVIREWNVSLAVDIVIGDDLVFRAKLGDTNKGNDEWLAGKAAVAVHYAEPSLLAKLRNLESGTDIATLDVDHDTLKFHGGSIPLLVGGAVVATITMSGEPDVIDHQACAEAVRRYLAQA